MKLFKITILLLLIDFVSYSQTIPCDKCGVKGITTDPIAPANIEKPIKKNTFFDWTSLGQFDVFSQYWSAPYNHIESPFNQIGRAHV